MMAEINTYCYRSGRGLLRENGAEFAKLEPLHNHIRKRGLPVACHQLLDSNLTFRLMRSRHLCEKGFSVCPARSPAAP